MDVDPVGIRLILRRRCLDDRVENGLLARKVIVERGSLDADRLRDLAHADRIIALRRKQPQRLVQNFLPGILLLHGSASLTNVR